VPIVLTLVQTKQIRINIHKGNNARNTEQTIQNTVNTSTHITKIPTHYQNTHTLPKYPHITKHPQDSQINDGIYSLLVLVRIYGLFNEHDHSSGNPSSNGRIISEFEGIWKEAIVVQFEPLIPNMIGGSETDHENSQWNEIGNQNFPYTYE